jgi:ribosomal protein S3
MSYLFIHVLPKLGVKGLKIRLKGKISAAGNSRKRLILYRIGKTSFSQTSLKVLAENDTVITFTGVMGLNLFLFY